MSSNNPPRSRTRLSLLAVLIMRVFFHLLYHSLAWTYDWIAALVSVGRWQDWVASAAALVKGPRVLELGYGPGHLQLNLRAAGLDVTGIDESFQMARQASRRMARRGFSPRLARGLAQRLPFPEAVFDTVITTFPSLYIFDPGTLSEARRVLRPEGRLIVLLAAWITGKRLIDRLMDFVIRLAGQSPQPLQNLESFSEPFSQAGFKASFRFLERPGSRVMIILAQK